MRFSLKTLLVFTTLLAVTVASLMYPVPLVASGYFFAAVIAVIGAAIVASQRLGTQRAFWASFVITAVAYAAIAIPAGEERGQQIMLLAIQNSGVTQLAELSSPMPTTLALYMAYDALHLHHQYAATTNSGGWVAYPPVALAPPVQAGSNQPPAYVAPIPAAVAPQTPQSVLLRPNSQSFMVIGESFWTVLLGLLGGMFGERLHRGCRTVHAPLSSREA